MTRLRIVLATAAIVAPLTAASGHASPTSVVVFAADRAPSLTGEIYRVDPNGHRIDLSNSPFQDTDPAVSSDGKRVAFISDRRGREGVYEVGSGGRGLTHVPAALGRVSGETSLAWQPHGTLLAVDAAGEIDPQARLWIVRPHHKPVEISRHFGFGIRQPWSPDGRVLLVGSLAYVRAVSPHGRTLWRVPVARAGGAWSSQGLLAVTESRGAAVYDEHGRLRFSLRLGRPLSFAGPSWSADGSKLVLPAESGSELEVATSTGTVLLRKHVRYGQLGWAGNDRLVLGYVGKCECRVDYLDVHTGRLSRGGSLRWFAPLSADGKLAIVTPRSGGAFSLAAGSPDGGTPKRYAPVPGCWDDDIWEAALSAAQFVGTTRSLVYASLCYEPFSNLYSVAPGGGNPHEIGAIAPYATLPALSPNGSEVAYSWAKFTGMSCKGCVSEIRVANADGTGEQVLTKPSEDCTFDLSPTWSPDGRTLLYTEQTCDSLGELFTVPAAGGTPHDLGITGYSPAWGPTRIAYIDSSESDTGLWTANPDGSDPVQVAKKGVEPAWASDGRLAYVLKPATVVVGPIRVRLPFASITSLAWSPDGTRFVVTARAKGAAAPDVYSVSTDGTGLVRLTKNYDAWGVSWR